MMKKLVGAVLLFSASVGLALAQTPAPKAHPGPVHAAQLLGAADDKRHSVRAVSARDGGC